MKTLPSAAALALCAASCLGASAHTLVDFTRAGHGWQAANHVSNARQTETGYAFEVTDEDPWCVSGGLIKLPPPGNASHVRIELETAPMSVADSYPGEFELFWHKDGEHFAASRSVLLEPTGPKPFSVFSAKLPLNAFDAAAPMALRIDPPGRSSSFAGAEYRRLRVVYLSPEWTPSFSAPPALELSSAPLELSGEGWTLRHDRGRAGAFSFSAGGKTWAEGYPNEPFAIRGPDGKAETLDWSRGSFSARADGAKIEACAKTRDSSGRTWEWRRTFTARGPELHIETSVSVDRPADVYHVPYLTLFVDRASGGRKTQALVPGIEYLSDEPSSNEKEVRGPQANRLIPAAHKFCFNMMAIADATSWFALEWTRPAYQPFAAVFDTPDRQFHSGGHLFALWAPGIGQAREEGDLRIFGSVPFTSGKADAVLSTGPGGDVVDAMTARLPLGRLPPTPALDAARSCDVLSRGWLDSGIRDGNRCRHALGPNWRPDVVSDMPALMLWLASATPDASAAARLTEAANAAISALPEGSAERKGWGRTVSHVRRPAAPLLFGDPLAYSAMQTASARSLAAQLADGKRIWRAPGGGRPDYGETLGADHCNGFTAIAEEEMLAGALWTGDEALIAAAVKSLDRFTEVYGDDVPRGAQPWEMPLHTPDILASGRLVGCYVRGYLLSGKQLYLERARYWARTGMAMVYFLDPPGGCKGSVGRYATTGVIGATNWAAPNWIGLPVQWCGLVYSAALADLADVETDPGLAALWRHMAKGITASGVDQCYLQCDGNKVGLLPDSFNLVKQERRDPPINPGTVQENVSNFIGLPYYRVVRATPEGNTLLHVPGRAAALPPDAGEIARVEIAAWPKSPFKVLFSRVQRPSGVKADGVAVPFEHRDGVMAVSLQPSCRPVSLSIER